MLFSLKKFLLQFLRALGEIRIAVGFIIVVTLLFLAIFAVFISPNDPYEMSNEVLNPPNLKYPMGTDHFGRGMLSRVIYGTRVSYFFALGAAGISLVFGVILGAIPGYYGGLVDDVFSRFYDFFLIIPQLVLLIFVIALFGSNIFFSMIVVGLTMWPSNAKITRAQVLSLKHRTFVEAAIVTGASPFRVVWTHILPNGIYPIIANSTLQMATAVIIEASLSFLGLGDPNYVSWGQLIHTGQFYIQSAWWMTVFPGLFIFILAFAFNILGEGINLKLNPRLGKAYR